MTTTTPDDVLYVLKVIMKRLLSLGSISAAKHTLEVLREAMDHKYLGLMKKRIDESIGNLNTSRPDRSERGSRLSLIVRNGD